MATVMGTETSIPNFPARTAHRSNSEFWQHFEALGVLRVRRRASRYGGNLRKSRSDTDILLGLVFAIDIAL